MIDQQRFQQYLSEILGDLEINPNDSRYYVRADSPQAARATVSLSQKEYEFLESIKPVPEPLEAGYQDLYSLLITYHLARTDVSPVFNRALQSISNVVRQKARANIGDIILRAWKNRELRRQKTREV